MRMLRLAVCSLVLLQCFGPRPPSAEQQAALLPLVKSSNGLGLDLLRTLHDSTNPQNIAVSPTGLSALMTMAWTGARGATADSMAAVLGLADLSREQGEDLTPVLMRWVFGPDRGVDIEVANSAWVREGIPVRQEYTTTLRDRFFADVHELDFASPNAVKAVNDWVSRKTRNLIPQMLASLDNPDMLVLLVNALFFKGKWKQPFDPKYTGPARFRLADGTVAERQMMQSSIDVKAESRPGVAIVRLPYKSPRWAMYVLVPQSDEADSYEDYLRWAEHRKIAPETPGQMLQKLLRRLGPDTLDRWIAGMEMGEDVTVGLPRFTLDCTFDLGEAMRPLGMGAAFEPDADFSGVGPGFYLTAAVQRSVVSVEEHGTLVVSAAMTTIGCVPQTVWADVPFVFVIRDDETGTILSLGIVADPAD